MSRNLYIRLFAAFKAHGLPITLSFPSLLSPPSVAVPRLGPYFSRTKAHPKVYVCLASFPYEAANTCLWLTCHFEIPSLLNSVRNLAGSSVAAPEKGDRIGWSPYFLSGDDSQAGLQRLTPGNRSRHGDSTAPAGKFGLTRSSSFSQPRALRETPSFQLLRWRSWNYPWLLPSSQIPYPIHWEILLGLSIWSLQKLTSSLTSTATPSWRHISSLAWIAEAGLPASPCLLTSSRSGLHSARQTVLPLPQTLPQLLISGWKYIP